MEAADESKLAAKVAKLESQLSKERERSRDNLRKLMNAVKERDELAAVSKEREDAAEETTTLRQQLAEAQVQVENLADSLADSTAHDDKIAALDDYVHDLEAKHAARVAELLQQIERQHIPDGKRTPATSEAPPPAAAARLSAPSPAGGDSGRLEGEEPAWLSVAQEEPAWLSAAEAVVDLEAAEASENAEAALEEARAEGRAALKAA
eukprot:1080232-Prymnesium_polylepis.1